MLQIGLTGGIGSGKSTVAKIFELLDIPVYYADDAARQLMNSDEELKKKIIQHFGNDSYIDDQLSRGYISSIVFNSKEKLELLNSLIHPAVMHDSEKWMRKQTAVYTLREAALIFESGIDKYLDFVIGVSAPEELRIQRALDRDKISKQQVIARMKNQMGEEEKMKLCDFIIYNDEQQLLMPQVLVLHKKLSRLSCPEEFE